MATTSLSLLDRLRRAAPDDPDWQRLQEIYLPLIRRWIARVPGMVDESDDVAQEVLAVTASEIPRFERRREGSFRAWLLKVTVNKIRTYRKSRRRQPDQAAENFLEQLADPRGELAKEWDLDHDRHVFGKLLAIIRPDYSPTTWEAFRRFVFDEIPAALVAKELGLSENAVTRAKFRITKRLREELGELMG